MKKIKLSIITFLFSSFLVGCEMTGQQDEPKTEVTKIDTKQTSQKKTKSTTKKTAKAAVKKAKKKVVAIKEELKPPVLITEPLNQSIISAIPIFIPNSDLLAVPATHFTLQFAALDSDSLNNFIHTHSLPQPNTHVYETLNNNQTQYIIFYGEYRTHEAAKIASQSLPGSFANMETWIKQYQLIHKEILVQ